MPGIDRTLADDLLKNIYGDDITDWLNNEVRSRARFRKSDSAKWNGRQFIEAVRKGRNHGHKASGEGGLLPTPAARSTTTS